MTDEQRDLKIRMREDDVKNSQAVLAASGCVIVDELGYFDPEPRRAVEETQRRLGLSLTGVVAFAKAHSTTARSGETMSKYTIRGQIVSKKNRRPLAATYPDQGTNP